MMSSLNETLGFSLTEVSRLLRKRFDERAREIGITRSQWHTMFILVRNEGINQGQLADMMEVEPITACRMIDRLEEAGLVERRRDPADRRMWRLHLTEKSHPLLKQLRDIGLVLSEEALDGVSEEARATVANALDIIRANLTRNGDANVEERANG